MIRYIIDIGSNSCRLMKAEQNGENITPIYKKLITCRTGEGVNATHKLSPAAIERTVKAVEEFANIVKNEDNSAQIFCFATSATRDALNRDEMLNEIYSQTGIKVDVLSGEDEAKIGFVGAVGKQRAGLLDIGGGSTEVIFGENGSPLYAKSFNIGAVRAKDMFGNDCKKTYEYALSLFSEIPHFDGSFYACGGTCTTVAAMIQELKIYDPQKTHGFIISKEVTDDLFNKLACSTSEEIKNMNGIQPERADIISHGVAILLAFLHKTGYKGITTSEADNLEGYIISKLLK